MRGDMTAHEREDGEVPYAVQLLFTWVVISFQLLWRNQGDFRNSLIDTDDAMRLVEVRALLAGRGWFDLHEPRVSPPGGYDTHWSRLIDAGLTGLYHLFSPFTSPQSAEYLMRASWPLLCLLATLAAVMAVSRRLAGEAGLFAAGFISVLNTSAFYQFTPGRIDHHSAQIALTMLALAGISWADKRPWAAAGAGICAALALAVGLECLPLIALMLAAVVVRYLAKPEHYREVAFLFGSFAVAIPTVFLGTVSPARIMFTACDALGWNLVVPLAAGSGALAVAVLPPVLRKTGPRFILTAAIGVTSCAAAILLDVRCLSGPFALISPEARTLWLDHVQESRPIFSLLGTTTFAITGLPLIINGLLVSTLMFDKVARRDFLFRTLVAVFAFSTVLAFTNAKMSIYALWFAVPLLAMVAVRLWARFNLGRALTRVASIVLIAPAVYIMLGLLITGAFSTETDVTASDRACNHAGDFRLLARLPPGLVLSDVDSGPFILANTPHSVWSAPYHRLANQIVQSIRIFDSPPDAARPEILKTGAQYVAVCRPNRSSVHSLQRPNTNSTLQDVLLNGAPPEWLKPVIGDGGNFLIFKVETRS